MTKLGFVGLGVMGQAITRRLLESGYVVTGFNRTRDKAADLIAAGMGWADSPRKVAESSDVIFSMVTDDAAVTAVATGEEGILARLEPGKIYVEMSTIRPDTTRELAQKAAENGVYVLDAPVVGSSVVVPQGKLAIMVGGNREAFEQVLPVLQDIGPRVTYIGESGMALVMKIALNLNIPVQLLGLFEALALAEKYGIQRETALDVMLNSAIASPAMQYRGPFALALPEDPLFRVTGTRKDLAMALELGRAADVPLLTAAAADQLLATTSALGLDQEDLGVLYKVLAKLSGIE